MKNLLLALLLVSSPAYALDVGISKKYAHVVYDVAEEGGESVPHDLGVTLPAGSILTNIWVYINTPFTDAGTGSLGFQCAGTLDLMYYQDPTAWSAYDVLQAQLGVTSYGASQMIAADGTANKLNVASRGSIPTACSVYAVVRGDSGYVPLAAGKATVILEYFAK